MADNATSNDTCIDTVLQAIYPNMSAKAQLEGSIILYDILGPVLSIISSLDQ